MAIVRIPLFPLRVVLLPGKVLPLHIFEPRYKQMIADVGGQGGLFGMAQAHDEGLSRVGCTALIVRVVKTYDDGRMDIVTIGRTPFRISEVHEEKSYLEATADLLADTEAPQPAPPSDPAAKELRALFRQVYLLINSAPPEEVPEGTNVPLSYRLAGELPLDLNVLQDLLATRIEKDRQGQLTEHLSSLLPRLERRARMRSRSSGNGHGPN